MLVASGGLTPAMVHDPPDSRTSAGHEDNAWSPQLSLQLKNIYLVMHVLYFCLYIVEYPFG